MCSVDGCTNYLVQEGGAVKDVEQRSLVSCAQLMDAQTEDRVKGSALDVGRRSRNAATKDAQTDPFREVFALATAQRLLDKHAAMKDVPNSLSVVGSVRGTGQRRKLNGLVAMKGALTGPFEAASVSGMEQM